MPTDFNFTLPNQPGTGARVLDALGHAGVNVIGACAVSQDSDSIVHLAVDDAEGARAALQAAGVQISGEREVAITAIERAERSGESSRIWD